MTHPIEIAALEREIENLIASYPELAEDETLRADMIAGSTETEEILSKIVDRLQDAESMSKAIQSRIADLEARKASFDRKKDAMKALAQRVMNVARVAKMPLPAATLYIRQSPPTVIVSDQTMIPREFIRTKEEPDRAKIKAALQNGVEVPGAYLSNGGEGLSIRVK